MEIKIKRLHNDAVIPTYAHGPDVDAGMDLRAMENVVLYKDVPTLVKTGLSIELPSGYEGQVRPRSGLALKCGITVLNSPGTIDPGYRGEIGVILVWNGYNPNSEKNARVWLDYPSLPAHKEVVYEILAGERIAQLVVAQYVPVSFVEDELAPSTRGVGGFGSSGV